MAMSELKQKLLLQELAEIGFKEARYIPASDKIIVKPDDNRMPYIDDEGLIWYGSEQDKFVQNTIRPLVNKVNEVMNAWENAQPMPFDDIKHFRLLTEHHNTVLAARELSEAEYGFEFVTWQYNQDRTAVGQGKYTINYDSAKDEFIKQAGLMPDAVIYKNRVSEDILERPEYSFGSMAENLDAAYKNYENKFEQASPLAKEVSGSIIPETENVIIQEQPSNLYQKLIDKIDAEMNEYTDYLMAMDKHEIIGKATDTAMREEIVWAIKNNEYDFDDDAIEHLLNYDDLLTQTAGMLKGHVLDEIATHGDVEDVIDNIIAYQYEKSGYSLDDYISVSDSSVKAVPEKGFTETETAAVETHSKTLYQRFSEKIDAEMDAFIDSCIQTGSNREIISNAYDIVVMDEAACLLQGNYDLSNADLEYLLSYDNLLEELADYWKDTVKHENETAIVMSDCLDGLLNKSGNSLDADLSGDGELNENAKKPSILADLAEKLNEVKPTDKQDRGVLEIE